MSVCAWICLCFLTWQHQFLKPSRTVAWDCAPTHAANYAKTHHYKSLRCVESDNSSDTSYGHHDVLLHHDRGGKGHRHWAPVTLDATLQTVKHLHRVAHGSRELPLSASDEKRS